MPKNRTTDEAALRSIHHKRNWVALQTLQGHTGEVCALAFSPDGTLASGGDDGTIRIWDSRSGAALLMLESDMFKVSAVAFSPDGKILASGSWDRVWGDVLSSGSGNGAARLWDGWSGAALCKLEGHVANVSAVAFSSDSKTVASGSRDRTVRLWDGRSGAALHNSRAMSTTLVPWPSHGTARHWRRGTGMRPLGFGTAGRGRRYVRLKVIQA